MTYHTATTGHEFELCQCPIGKSHPLAVEFGDPQTLEDLFAAPSFEKA